MASILPTDKTTHQQPPQTSSCCNRTVVVAAAALLGIVLIANAGYFLADSGVFANWSFASSPKAVIGFSLAGAGLGLLVGSILGGLVCTPNTDTPEPTSESVKQKTKESTPEPESEPESEVDPNPVCSVTVFCWNVLKKVTSEELETKIPKNTQILFLTGRENHLENVTLPAKFTSQQAKVEGTFLQSCYLGWDSTYVQKEDGMFKLGETTLTLNAGEHWDLETQEAREIATPSTDMTLHSNCYTAMTSLQARDGLAPLQEGFDTHAPNKLLLTHAKDSFYIKADVHKFGTAMFPKNDDHVHVTISLMKKGQDPE